MSFEYWFMLPVSFVFATIAIASGVGGATFFAPFFMLALRLPPEIAIGTGLITEVFGFASGLYAYARKKLIDYKLGLTLLTVTVPMALLGTWVSGAVEANVLKAVLGMGLFAIAAAFMRAPQSEDIDLLDTHIQKTYGGVQAETCIITRDQEKICYTVCNKTQGRLIAGIGGLFVGMISTGLGELNGYFLLQRCRVPSAVSVATSVFVVAVTVLIASLGHFYKFTTYGPETLQMVFSIVMFTIPGVIVGAQAGSFVSRKIPQPVLEKGLGILFMLLAFLTIGEIVLH
ncbi:MAG: sulfite exporter TauE/SafE family protein [candidate division KSB1 bacterium]|nr:sulfite exporter TauE/SafE family protein [candidate division KSB1 bacterium]